MLLRVLLVFVVSVVVVLFVTAVANVAVAVAVVAVVVVVAAIAAVDAYVGAVAFRSSFAGSGSADDPALLPEALGSRKGKESRCGCVRRRVYVAAAFATTTTAAAVNTRLGKSTARAT